MKQVLSIIAFSVLSITFLAQAQAASSETVCGTVSGAGLAEAPFQITTNEGKVTKIIPGAHFEYLALFGKLSQSGSYTCVTGPIGNDESRGNVGFLIVESLN
jgi:hypothetical protein